MMCDQWPEFPEKEQEYLRLERIDLNRTLQRREMERAERRTARIEWSVFILVVVIMAILVWKFR